MNFTLCGRSFGCVEAVVLMSMTQNALEYRFELDLKEL